MSFYCGPVAKLVESFRIPGRFDIVQLLQINTADDANMHIDFSHGHIIRAVFIPVNEIVGFVDGTTTTVSRIFNSELGIEIWQSLQ